MIVFVINSMFFVSDSIFEATRDFDLVLVETFDEVPYLLADPFDRSDRTLFD